MAIFQPTKNTLQPKISLIIPARNEETNIGKLLAALSNQSYPKELTEIIVVDDHSTDNTATIVQQFPFAKLIQLKEDAINSYKKKAIEKGIAEATGELIVTTDADCNVNPGWLRAINSSFSDESVKMSFGAVRIQSDQTIFSRLQALEFSSLIGSGASTAAFGFPTMCNGANLAFTKEAFLQTNGYTGNEQIASGDDEFLMRKIEAKSGIGSYNEM